MAKEVAEDHRDRPLPKKQRAVARKEGHKRNRGPERERRAKRGQRAEGRTEGGREDGGL
jgi:hypothetical protein